MMTAVSRTESSTLSTHSSISSKATGSCKARHVMMAATLTTTALTTELLTDSSISFKETVDPYRLADTAPLAFRNTWVHAGNLSVDSEDVLHFLLSDILGYAQMYQDDDSSSILSLKEVSEDFKNPFSLLIVSPSYFEVDLKFDETSHIQINEIKHALIYKH